MGAARTETEFQARDLGRKDYSKSVYICPSLVDEIPYGRITSFLYHGG